MPAPTTALRYDIHRPPVYICELIKSPPSNRIPVHGILPLLNTVVWCCLQVTAVRPSLLPIKVGVYDLNIVVLN